MRVGVRRQLLEASFSPSTVCVSGTELLLSGLTEPVQWPQAWLIMKHRAEKTWPGATKGEYFLLSVL